MRKGKEEKYSSPETISRVYNLNNETTRCFRHFIINIFKFRSNLEGLFIY